MIDTSAAMFLFYYDIQNIFFTPHLWTYLY